VVTVYLLKFSDMVRTRLLGIEKHLTSLKSGKTDTRDTLRWSVRGCSKLGPEIKTNFLGPELNVIFSLLWKSLRWVISGEDKHLVESENLVSRHRLECFGGTMAGGGRDISGDKIFNSCGLSPRALLGVGRVEGISHFEGTLCNVVVVVVDAKGMRR
jgi:hypothetical protein